MVIFLYQVTTSTYHQLTHLSQSSPCLFHPKPHHRADVRIRPFSQMKRTEVWRGSLLGLIVRVSALGNADLAPRLLGFLSAPPFGLGSSCPQLSPTRSRGPTGSQTLLVAFSPFVFSAWADWLARRLLPAPFKYPPQLSWRARHSMALSSV